MKTLKLYNGHINTGKYDRGHVYIAAYSNKQASEIISDALNQYITPSNIKTYYHKGCWGNSMDNIIPTEPCVYVIHNKEQILIYPKTDNEQ
jgi:hypothetical protein